MSHGNRTVVRVVTGFNLIIPLTAAIGQVLGVPILYTWAYSPGMALNTAVSFILLSMTILFVAEKDGNDGI